ncbi:armadillo-type protein [Pilobolus umbonatus]|nr:armadillo-type protein [Pilobolus umbonatus]
MSKELEQSKDDHTTASILLKRAKVYQANKQINKSREDALLALQRDPSSQETKDLLVQLTMGTPAQPITKEEEPKDPRDDTFQERLSGLSGLTSAQIRQFVSSNEFVVVLTAAGAPNTPLRIRSLAFMILTQLLNPPEGSKEYPIKYIIEQCASCFSQCVDQGTNEAKLLAYKTLNAIFQSSMTAGAAIFCQEGTVEEIIDVVEFESLPVQLAIAEVLAIAASDKSCTKPIIKYASDWLAKIAGQKNTDPQLRAIGGTALTKLKAQVKDSNDPEEGSQNLEDAMRRMHLTNESLVDTLKQVIKSKPSDTHVVLNAIEGLAYSSLKPGIKANLGNDGEFLKCLATLTVNVAQAKGENSNPLLFGIGNIFANLTMYRPVLDEQQKQMQKLKEMAYAKQRQAEGKESSPSGDDPREDECAVEERIKTAVSNGVSIALMALSKNSSINIRSITAQTYLNLVTPQAVRGQLLQQGIVKGLFPLTRDAGETGMLASQALAKLAITADPRIAFTNNLVLDLVRPFLDNLCKNSSNQLRQFEGLMALTNLASVDDRVRLMIDKADGMTVFENLQLSSNDMVQRAATEMVCNMTFCEPVFEKYSDPKLSQNKIRLLFILSDHEDPATRRAASGALAILANSPGTCEMLVKNGTMVEFRRDCGCTTQRNRSHSMYG